MEKGKYHTDYTKVRHLLLLISGLFVALAGNGQRINELASGKTIFNDYSVEVKWMISSPTSISGKVGGYMVDSSVGLASVNIQLTNEPEIINYDLSVYPNPFIHEFIIIGNENWEAQFLDQRGVVIEDMTLIDGLNRIDTRFWKNGIYFLRIKTESEVQSLKLIKAD